jgi:hypothetical protein
MDFWNALFGCQTVLTCIKSSGSIRPFVKDFMAFPTAKTLFSERRQARDAADLVRFSYSFGGLSIE